MLQRLSNTSGIPQRTLADCMLTSFSGVVSEAVNARGNSPGILPLGVYHRKRTRCSLMFCPACLRDDDYPYFRKIWRLSFVSVCLQHELQLLDHCPQCLKEIAPHRVDMQWRSQTTRGSALHVRCYGCGGDLRRATAVTASTEDLVAGAWVFQALQDGWVHLGDSAVYSPAFFAGLTALIQGVDDRADRLTFGMTPIFARRQLLRQACALLEAWPREFLKVASTKQWTTTTLLLGRRPLPFWLRHVVKTNLDRAHAPISPEEAHSIFEQTAPVGRRRSFSHAKLVSGRTVERHHVSPMREPGVDDETFALFLAQIDHRIAQTWDDHERAHLLADKVIFAVARIYGLTQVHLVRLSLADGRDMANDDVPVFWAGPTTKLEVGAWVGWYLRSVRPRLHPAMGNDSLFVGRVGGKPLSANAIGERFARHCGDAYLRRQIPGYVELALPL
jgi:hypothetical protein